MTSQTKIGLNAWGDVCMWCGVCDETFAKKIQGKTLSEFVSLDHDHQQEKHKIEEVPGGGAA